MEKKLGHHLICELTNGNSALLDNEGFIIKTLTEACVLGGAGVIGVQSHKFSPQGVTCLVLLSESHCSIHTWPEFGYAMLDCCTCGNKVQPHKILEIITEKLGGKPSIREIERGIPINS